MNKDKRKLNTNQSSQVTTKKKRNEIDQTVMSIENLSNEIFYEIFDYLDGCNIYQIFANLNSRFEKLLNSSSLLFKIKIRPTLKERFIKNYKEIILFHKNQILSIHFSSVVYHQMISLLNIDCSFNRLESLVFDSIQPFILTPLLSKLIHLPRFFSLTIDTQKTLHNLIHVYRLIFDLPKLQYLRLFAMETNDTSITVSLPININNQFSTIKHLVIDHPCAFNELFSIISYTPQITRLSFIHKAYSTFKTDIISPIILSNLTHLSIYGDHLQFDKVQMFITKIDAKLKVLSVKSLAKDITYLNANCWKELIMNNFPQLEEFHLTFLIFLESIHRTSLYINKLNTFNSLFWIERQWLLQAEISLDTIIYSIHPFKKRWYEYQSQDQMIHPSNELLKSMRILFTIIPYYDNMKPLKQIISHISNVADIYHLEIDEEIYTDTLMEILVLLPELDSLKISSLLYSNPIYINGKDSNVLCLLTSLNQITKVYLMKMTKMEEIDFLIELCPQMIYLKVEFLHHINIQLFVRVILTKINMKFNHKLRLLCARVKAVDNDIIEKLNSMINSENLLTDYTIKRITDDIYLQWK
ncbi:unnamed protein product [Rotaria sp. Silwood1]|nr:unnamed protein product [Rotaria sp. Silwood1]